MASKAFLSDKSKSYKTSYNAHRAMSVYDDTVRYVIVYTATGRHMPLVIECGNYMPLAIAINGFMVIGA